ncbi:MAG: hypothetical protein HUU01_05280 [Saprospiraceae bacterium]|nr:hypothetical protein [Saprospiraceae bacterium]
MTHTTTPQPRYIFIIWSCWKRSDPVFPASGYETWQVEGAAQDRLVLINEQADYAALIRTLLADAPHANVLAFLHRRSHDPVKDLSNITGALKSPDAAALRKAFAFSDGRDYLYLSANEWGLIGNEGRLWYSSGGEKTRSAESLSAPLTVKAAHFNKVWQYYSQQCKRKIFEFKEELLSALWTSPAANNADAVDNQDWLSVFKKEKPLLYARLLDLANEDSPKFTQLLASAEQKGQENLRFGECRLNMMALNGAGKQYERLADFIRNEIVNAEGPVRIADSMRTLRDCFDELLETLPEPTYP